MAHNLFGERFLAAREPAWHRLGHVTEKDMGAAAALKKVGKYSVNLKSLHLQDGTPIDHKAIVRSATPDDPHNRVFNVVGKKYHLLDPQTICKIWDEKVNRPVETFGALGNGETIFITTKLPGMNINGDIVENYLLVVSPMTGWDAAQVRVAPVRVVCQNTLVAAQNSSSESYRILHDQYVEERMAEWMTGVYERSEEKVKVLKQAFDILAKHNVTKAQSKKVIETVYPHPGAPSPDMPESILKGKRLEHATMVESINRRRAGVRQLLDGDGTGLETKATKGTAWGLYNAIVETEDYSTGRGKSTDRSLLFGDRAITKARAYKAALELAS